MSRGLLETALPVRTPLGRRFAAFLPRRFGIYKRAFMGPRLHGRIRGKGRSIKGGLSRATPGVRGERGGIKHFLTAAMFFHWEEVRQGRVINTRLLDVLFRK